MKDEATASVSNAGINWKLIGRNESLYSVAVRASGNHL